MAEREGKKVRVYDCEQGSEKWLNIRRGRPTASRFKDILTPARLQLAKGRDEYAIELALEIHKIKDESKFSGNYATDRGHENEPLAVERYQQLSGFKTEKVGFCYPDHCNDYGCSPDRLVFVNGKTKPDGLLEVKTNYPKNLIKNLRDPDQAVKEHMLQVQGQLWVTGLEWCDLFFDAPELNNSFSVRIEPDPDVFEKLEKHIPQFVQEVKEMAELIKPNPDFQVDEIEW